MMAAYAFERARRFSEKSEKPIFGLACTAALATGRTRRGENRFHCDSDKRRLLPAGHLLR